MLTIKSAKGKNTLTLLHEGRNETQEIKLLVDQAEKAFIAQNLDNIQFDVTGQKFYITQETKRGPERTTLQRALWKDVKGSKRVPERISRPDRFDFRTVNFQAA